MVGEMRNWSCVLVWEGEDEGGSAPAEELDFQMPKGASEADAREAAKALAIEQYRPGATVRDLYERP